MGGRADREREAADQRDAAVEAHQLHGDLTLVVVHGENGIEVAVLGPQEHRVRRERPLDREPLGSGLLDRRLDDVDLLATEIAAVARMRVEARDRDARRD